MNEVKKPKKPLIFYYGIVMLVILLFNLITVPWFLERQIQEVDYGTFMSMTESSNIGQVDVQENQIIFTVFLIMRLHPTCILFPYTLLFRSIVSASMYRAAVEVAAG